VYKTFYFFTYIIKRVFANDTMDFVTKPTTYNHNSKPFSTVTVAGNFGSSKSTPVYVNVCSGTRKHKFQSDIVNLVYQHPIIGDMTATIAAPFSYERVVMMLWFKRSLLQ